jgi:imidazole glycerol-phosphate synthase subunit HisH
MTTVIIDSGGANLASLQFALQRLEADAVVSGDPQDIIKAPRVILPGVGAAQDAMTRLRATGLHEVIPKLTQPVLGICLGMQLLFARSEEGSTECLGVIPDTVRRMQPEPGRPVPHMGWNQLTALRADPLLRDVAENEYVYFVHSYAARVSDVTLAATDYGLQVSAVVRRNNFWGTQFHPERSGATGSKVLANFLRLE